jgi:Protein of unknown function (DUF3489)
MSNKFSKTQLAMMCAAAERGDRCFVTSPALKGGAAQKIAAKLMAADLAKEIKAKVAMPVWRRDAVGGQPFALKLTAAGLRVVAVTGETGHATESQEPISREAIVGSTSFVNAAIGSKHLDYAGPREGSKLAAVVAMLRRSEGATIDDLTAATGWLPHTTRAAITGLRKRGYSVVRERTEDGGPAYRISDSQAGESGAQTSSQATVSGRPRREPKAKQAP